MKWSGRPTTTSLKDHECWNGLNGLTFEETMVIIIIILNDDFRGLEFWKYWSLSNRFTQTLKHEFVVIFF